MFTVFGLIASLAFAALPATADTAPPKAGLLTSIDLAKPFKTRSPWRFTTTQGTPVADGFGGPGDTVAGKITLCLSHDGKNNCETTLLNALGSDEANAWNGPHFLKKTEIEQPDAHPLLVVQSASLWSGDGDYGTQTIALRYDRRHDRFVVAYQHGAEHNQNGDARYIATGPLRGDFISAQATDDAPFGYWMVVNHLGADDVYHQVLRYRSATHYGDNNPLAVIDSEMPNIEQRLHLWRPGQPLPLPAGKCPKPHLVHSALWCE